MRCIALSELIVAADLLPPTFQAEVVTTEHPCTGLSKVGLPLYHATIVTLLVWETLSKPGRDGVAMRESFSTGWVG